MGDCQCCIVVDHLNAINPSFRKPSTLQEWCIKSIVENTQCLNKLTFYNPFLPTIIYNRLFQLGRFYSRLPKKYDQFHCRIAALRNIFSKKDLTFPKNFVAWFQSRDSYS